MTPARRTELSRMGVDGELEQVPVDPTVCRTMVEQARRHARTGRRSWTSRRWTTL